MMASTFGTTSASSMPPANAWQVSRQNPMPESPTASHRPTDAIEPARHCAVAAGRILDQDRQLHVEALGALAPVVEADLGIVGLQHMTGVDDQRLGADLGRAVDVLLKQLAARNPDPVVGGRDVQTVWGVHVEVEIVDLGRGA